MGVRFLNGIGWPPQPVNYISTTDTTNTETTAVDIAGLAIGAGVSAGLYQLTGMLLCVSAATTTGVFCGITMPGEVTPSLRWFTPYGVNSISPTYDRTGGNFATPGSAPYAGGGGWPSTLDGTLIIAATTTGPMNAQLRSEIAGSEVKVLANSWLSLRKLS